MRGVGRLEAWLAGTKAALTSRCRRRCRSPKRRSPTAPAAPPATRSTTRPAPTRSTQRRRWPTHSTRRRSPPATSTPSRRRPSRSTTTNATSCSTASTAGCSTSPRSPRSTNGDAGWRSRSRTSNATTASTGSNASSGRLRLRTWTDAEGMWCLSGRFDPVTGVKLAAKLDSAVNALFAEQTPSTCPTDPIDKQRHLSALALAAMIDGNACRRAAGPTRVRGRGRQLTVRRRRWAGGRLGDSRRGTPPGAGRTDRRGRRPHRSSSATASCSTPPASSTWVARPGWRTGPSAERYERSTPRVRSPAAPFATPAASCTTSSGGATAAAPTSTTCCRCAPTTTPRSTTPDGTSPSAPNRELTIRFPDGTIHNTGPPSRQAA